MGGSKEEEFRAIVVKWLLMRKLDHGARGTISPKQFTCQDCLFNEAIVCAAKQRRGETEARRDRDAERQRREETEVRDADARPKGAAGGDRRGMERSTSCRLAGNGGAAVGL